MNLLPHISNYGLLFYVIFGAMLITGFFMHLQSKNFYTLYVFVRKFSMLDLEFPASALELANYIKGIFLLPKELSSKSLRALKGQLYLDFLFIPLFYSSIFLLCLEVAIKMNSWGNYIFTTLALIQVIPLICDVAENIYLLQKIHPNVSPSKPSVHKAYQLLGKIKWIIASVAVVFAISTLFYFWLSGNFSLRSIQFLGVIIGELIIVYILSRITSKRSEINLEKYQNTGN
ncbi:MAG: hypothetical protein ABI325_06550 [Ginsengibacter sp.]